MTTKRLSTDMKIFGNIFRTLLIPFVLCTLASSCVKEEFGERYRPADGESIVRLDFSASAPEVVITKATLNHRSENSIYNIFVFVFDENGDRVYGHWFEEGDADNTTAEEYWHVDNSETGTTTGWIQFRSRTGSNMKIYLIANLDSDMVRISSDLLQYSIRTEAELLAAPVTLNQHIVSRNGYFLMSGKMDGVTIDEPGQREDYFTIKESLALTRADAKVRFVFKTGDRPDERGQVIKSFTPSQWKVVNVPAGTKLMESESDAVMVPPETSTEDYTEYAGAFFDTPWTNFEDFNINGSTGFSFYMLENRQQPKQSFDSYNDRSRQLKDASGLNRTVIVDYTGADGAESSREMLLFENANDFSTYVIVNGQVEMDLQNSDEGQTLNAEVQYIIHLGDWDKFYNGQHWNQDRYTGFTNFDTERNHYYTYTVTINSVNNIRVEVESGSVENQPGATGDVVVAREEIAICDAHYESRTMTFHYSNFVQNGTLVTDDLTWRVSTPFSEGEPDRVNGQDIPTGLDYQWVHFRLNKRDADGKYYSDKRRKYTPRVFARSETLRTAEQNKEGDGTDGLAGYHNDGCMDIIAFVRYIKEQAELYHTFQELGGENTSDFDSDNPDEAKICVTAFVDEYYYDVNPITGVASPSLWKQFVNQPDRSLHILSNSRHSDDLESSATGSVITIRQKSIQCIYNTDPGYTELQTAWGVEHVDEYERDAYGNPLNWPYSNGNTTSGYNRLLFNGRYNTYKECNLDFGTNDADPQRKWNQYMDFEVSNSTPLLNDDHQQLRYACLTRNRDNNGDGKIDRDEFRWYMAANKQIEGIFFGAGLLTPSTRLYNRTAEEKASDDQSVWRQHVVSSTKHSENSPTVYWAEEGISTSSISQEARWLPGYDKNWSVRCVRNLGMDSDISMDSDTENVPQDYIETEIQADGSIVVTATHLNSAALRYYTSRELDFHNENSEENRLYRQFEVASSSNKLEEHLGTTTFDAARNYIDSHLTNEICPEGYRFPNQMELAIMHSYLGISNSMSRTGWSMGSYAVHFGNTPKNGEEAKTGFRSLTNGNITIGPDASTTQVRCVRDVR